ncbi:MAG: hypothetical protein ACXWG1_10020 [Usitatibacter sp.]
MKFQTFVHCAIGFAASLLLASCGGGGATATGAQGGALQINPSAATFYAGQPSTIVITGGRLPYSLVSSEPGVLPVPATLNSNSLDLIPNNPGVVDSGLGPNDLPVRTVNITARDGTGLFATAIIKVAQNFLTGYNIFFSQSTCPLPNGATAITPCSGGDTVVQLAATFNGSLHGNEAYRLDVVRGNFAFFDPLSSTNTTTQSFTTQSDHEGRVTAVIRVPAGTPTQVAILRVTHVATGVSTLQVFTIVAPAVAPVTLTAIPDSFTFTGPDGNTCGTGQGDFFVFDGIPPYSAVSSSQFVQVTPATSGSQPGRFTVIVGSTQGCANAAPIIVTDSQNNRTTVTVTSSRGAAAPAPTPVKVAPNTITLACGASGSVSVVGGTGAYSVSSSSPSVTATVAGNTITMTRVSPDPAGGPFPTGTTVSVTDGASADVVAVTSTKPTCP